MGVPGFFSWLLKKYRNTNIIIDHNLFDLDSSCDILYLDANCLFHPQCFKVLELSVNISSHDLLERLMIKRILNYITFLEQYVNPKKLFISVDGVAPMAKISQQRKRRFRSVHDNELKQQIKSKHGRPIGIKWSNTVITPGSIFMERLHKQLLKFINKDNDIERHYSSYHVCGEGEHKILEHLRTHYHNDEYIVIYGLDADLIFLALASHHQNIFLLREADHFNNVKNNVKTDINNVAEDLNYVSINLMREYINNYIHDNFAKRYSHHSLDTNHDFTDDFIIICYFLGNDFVPHLPSIDIKTGALDFLVNCYTDTFNTIKQPLLTFDNNNPILNNTFLDIFLKNTSRSENYYFQTILPKHINYVNNRPCPHTDSCDIELWNLEHMKCFDVVDPIQLGSSTPDIWKFKYYEHYFGVSSLQQSLINDVCHDFLVSIMWTTLYYFKGCPSWKWQYKYTHGPFISDLSNFFSYCKVNINHITFNLDRPLSPCAQLLSVLPPSCVSLLPKSFHSLVTCIDSPLIDLYPITLALDMINKDLYWKCIPYLPIVDSHRINTVVKKLQLTDQEKKRNSIDTEIYNNV